MEFNSGFKGLNTFANSNTAPHVPKIKLKAGSRLPDYSVSQNIPRAAMRLVYKTGIKEPKGFT